MSSWFSELYLNKNRKSLSNDFDINGNSFINQNKNNGNMRNYSNNKSSNNNNKKKCTNTDNKTTCDSKDSSQESESSDTESSEESEEEEDEEESGSYSSSSESDGEENKCENNNKKGKNVIKHVNNKIYRECCQTGLLKVNNNSYSVIFNSKSEDGCAKNYSIPKTKGLPYLK